MFVEQFRVCFLDSKDVAKRSVLYSRCIVVVLCFFYATAKNENNKLLVLQQLVAGATIRYKERQTAACSRASQLVTTGREAAATDCLSFSRNQKQINCPPGVCSDCEWSEWEWGRGVAIFENNCDDVLYITRTRTNASTFVRFIRSSGNIRHF